MTELEVYRNVLTELNKVQAPALLLKDYEYFYNKAVEQVIEEAYQAFEVQQKNTDELRVLSKTIVYGGGSPLNINKGAASDPIFTGTDRYYIYLPKDYLHILNCIFEFEDLNQKDCKCEAVNPSIFQATANKVTSNQWSSIHTNYYMKPSVKRPYYYISNIDEPVVLNNTTDDTVGSRNYANTSLPVMELKFGNNRRYRLNKVFVDYLRAPIQMQLTQDEIDAVGDTSATLEFPIGMQYKIINKIVMIALENAKDARLQTHVATNQPIPQQR